MSKLIKSVLTVGRRGGWWLAALLPAAVVVVYVARFRLGLPYWDGWELVPDLQKMFAGTLTLADVWRPHNEHRLLLPRLIMLALARLTAWNDAYEIAVSVAAAGGTAVLLLMQWARTAARLNVPHARRLAPLITLLVFALTQWENWLWGWQLIFYVETLLAVAALLLLANWNGRWPRLAGAAALGTAATFSLSLGLLLWPVGLVVLGLAGLARRLRPARLAAALGAWGLAGVGVFGMYFSGPAAGPVGWLETALRQPLVLTHYVLNFLGSPVLTYDFAFLFGALGLAAWAAGAGWLWRRHGPNPAQAAALVPWVSLGLFVISGAVLVGLSRLHLGPHQAIASRYVTLSYPFWVSLSALLYIAAAQPGPAGRLAALRGAARLGLAGITLLLLVSSAGGGLLGYYWRYQAVQPVRAAALAGERVSDEALRAVYPDPTIVRPWLDYLREAQLSLFRTAP